MSFCSNSSHFQSSDMMQCQSAVESAYTPVEFNNLSRKFSGYHKNDTNIALHFLTTPLGLLGFFSLIRAVTNQSTLNVFLVLLYLASLVHLPLGAFIGTVSLCMVIIFFSRQVKLGVISSLVLIMSSYLLQDAAHYITGEETYEDSYSGTSDMNCWSRFFVQHVYYLLPLCVNVAIHKLFAGTASYHVLNGSVPEIFTNMSSAYWLIIPLIAWATGSYCLDSKNGFCFFPGSPYASRVLTCNLVSDDSESRKSDLKTIRDWALRMMPATNMSSHWWYNDLTSDEKEAFDRCKNSSHIMNMFRNLFDERHYCINVIDGMNEVYVTGPPRKEEKFNSDQIFYTKHVDGPFGLFPFVSVFRCIVGMDRNLSTSTHFPMTNYTKNATEGEVLAFDFNREVHYITSDDSKKVESDEFRVVLKLHYCFYPKVLAPLGWLMHRLNVNYNQTFRALFLKTINPQTLYENFLAWNVVFNTTLFNNIEAFIGQRNVIYLGLIASMSFYAKSYTLFLVFTSFVHYLRYISTFYFREGIDFGSFKRDVLLFKTLALLQLFLLYLFPERVGYFFGIKLQAFTFDPVSIVMIVSGYTISVLATNALGLDRTYFGAELGHCVPKWVNQFPYGYIPHPMIVSQVWALLGFYKATHMRESWPLLLPFHIVLYFTHMMQEHFNIYLTKKQ